MVPLHSTAVEFNFSALTGIEIPLEELRLEPERIYWIHCDLNDKTGFAGIAKKLDFPESLIQLCMEEDAGQKVTDSGDSLTLQVTAPLVEIPDENYQVKEGNLIIYLTNQYCFTASYSQQPSLINFLKNYHRNIKYALTPGFMLFLILDNVINDYSSIMQHYEQITDNTEIIIREKHKGAYSEVIGIKKQVTKIKGDTSSLRDILMRISGHKIAVISEPCRLSLCGLLDHVQMIVNESDATREILNGSLEIIDKSLMERMNVSVKILTAISAIFLPLSVLMRVQEMHLNWFPIFHSHFFYFFVALMVVLIIGAIFLNRKSR